MKLAAGTSFVMALWLFTACQRPDEDQLEKTFAVTVQGLGSDCKLPLIDFDTKAGEVAQRTGFSSDYRRYYAINLAPAYWKTGTALNIVIRNVTASELPACTTLGIGYPAVAIVSAEAR